MSKGAVFLAVWGSQGVDMSGERLISVVFKPVGVKQACTAAGKSKSLIALRATATMPSPRSEC